MSYASTKALSKQQQNGGLSTSSSILTFSIVGQDNVQSKSVTSFFKTILASGSYSITGVLSLLAKPEGNLQSFIIYTPERTGKSPLIGADFSTTGLRNVQNIPFTFYYTSDGITPVEFLLQAVGATFSISAVSNCIQMFKIA